MQSMIAFTCFSILPYCLSNIPCKMEWLMIDEYVTCSPELGVKVIQAMRDKDVPALVDALEEYFRLNEIELSEELVLHLSSYRRMKHLN